MYYIHILCHPLTGGDFGHGVPWLRSIRRCGDLGRIHGDRGSDSGKSPINEGLNGEMMNNDG